MRFSERQGIVPVEKIIQRESIDNELRNSLWSLLNIYYWDSYNKNKYTMLERSDFVEGSNMAPLITRLWLHYFKKPVDTIPEYFWDCVKKLREYFFAAKWYEVYDFVEFIAANGPEENREGFIEVCNSCLERENSAYRFANGILTEITSEQEVQSLEEAIAKSSPFYGVREHLTTALALMSNRQSPDYRNSIKESISAVESLCKHLAKDDNATLGQALKRLEKETGLHPALKTAFTSLYGYTNDADGIRHALMDESNLTKADARFMLICCSAFVNYAIDKMSK
jgi:hypothetical protein